MAMGPANQDGGQMTSTRQPGRRNPNGNKNATLNGTIGTSGRLDTIFKRNRAAAVQCEQHLWQLFSDVSQDIIDGKLQTRPYDKREDDDPAIDSTLKIMADDVVVNSPVLFGGVRRTFTKTSDPSIATALRHKTPYVAFRIHPDSFQFVEVDMMAVLCMYTVTLFKDGGEEVEAVATSTWRQTAGADWMLCGHMAGFAD